MKQIIEQNLIVWNPPQHVTDHVGQVILPETVFFAAPPSEIGEVLTADSTMSVGKKMLQRPRGYGLKAASFIFMVIFFVLIFFAANNLSKIGLIAAIVAGIISAIVATKVGYITHTATFVGSKGYSKIEWDNRRQSAKNPEKVLFEAVTDFKSSVIHGYYGPIYHSSIYSAIATDANGKRIWSASVPYRKQRGNPPLRSLYYFYQSADNVWRNRANRRVL